MTNNRFTGAGSKKKGSKSRSGSRGRSKSRKSDASLTRGFGQIEIAEAEIIKDERSRQVPLKIPTAEITDAVSNALQDDVNSGSKSKYMFEQSMADAKMSALMGKTLE